MNTPNVIMAVKAISKNPNNNVWIVYFSNDNDEKFYCKSAVWERRIPITPQKRTGHLIATLAVEIAGSKGWASAQGREAEGGTHRGKASGTARGGNTLLTGFIIMR